MNKIKIQGDSKIDNPWVMDYISIAEKWEQICETENLLSEGLITPYGINASFIKLETPDFRIRIRKKLENVRSSEIDLTVWPISQMMHFDFKLKNQRNFDLSIKKNNLINRIISLFSLKSYQYSSNKSHLIISDKEELIFMLEDSGLFDFSKFHSIQYDKEIISFFFQSIPIKDDLIIKAINIANKINELLPTTAIKNSQD